MHLPWRRTFRVWPIQYTHGEDGFIRGLPDSNRDLAIPRRSGWFCWVDTAITDWGWRAYRPLKQTKG